MSINGDKIFSGSHARIWLDGLLVDEAFGFQAKIEIIKEDVPITGTLANGQKTMGYNCTGSLRLHKINSRLIKLLSDSIKLGINPRFQILSEVNDPAADGAERMTIKDASFNDITLADWEAKQRGTVEAPFTFTDWTTTDLV